MSAHAILKQGPELPYSLIFVSSGLYPLWFRGALPIPNKRKGGEVTRLGWYQWHEPGNLPVVYLVTQVGNWGTGNDDVGLIQSTKAPNSHALKRHNRSEC